MTKQQFRQYINGFDFINLFNYLGWAYIKESSPIKVDAEIFTLQSIAEKSGFRILICLPSKTGNIPEYAIRLKIHNQLSRLFKEHLIIFINKQSTQQTWQTVQKEKPAKLSIVNWNKGQEPELLFQKTNGLLFTLDEEDNITIVDVTKRVAENFQQNNEKVTKQFYERFKQQHTAFLKFIKGIEDKVNQEWYASLMLNRLMFCYFIQKKGFLDNNKKYLTDKPLYVVCITRMRGFTEDEDRRNKEEKKTFSHKYKFFREVLQNIQSEQHPNLEYFIYKTIILRNLYGVDIMNEAVEIAKLRLFLKLVATVEADYRRPNLGLEPLPDIDFNIRAGNTLVGFATIEELKKGLRYTLDGVAAAPAIEEKCDIVAKAFSHYKEIQLSYGDDYKEFKKAKDDLNKRLKELNQDLNLLLHKQTEGIKYENWLKNYKPFHWFAEFYEIIHDEKGFDVIVGNPPYVEYSKIKKDYLIKNYVTETCGNLYAFVLECATKILKNNGKLSVIIPLASFSTKRMSPLQKLYTKNGKYLYISNYEATSHPTVLFVGVNVQLSIIFWHKELNNEVKTYSTSYRRCYSSERSELFENITFTSPIVINGYITRLSNPIENSILSKLFSKSKIGNFFGTNHPVYYRNMGNFYFKIAFDNIPKYYKDGELQMSSTVSILHTSTELEKYIFIAVINSTLFYYYWILFSDCYHLSKVDVSSFPLDLLEFSATKKKEISNLASSYLKSLEANAVWQIENKKDGTVKRYRRYFPQNCKPISDKIDTVLAEHYNFTNEELDFILNYDIKYRIGKELESEE